MYCASFSCAATIICLTFSFFFVCTSLPAALAISVSTLKTPRTVSGFGFISITCAARERCMRRRAREAAERAVKGGGAWAGGRRGGGEVA